MVPGGREVTVANALTDQRRKVEASRRSRRRCDCGCGRRATHVGTANGIAMMSGCELQVARWVRDPVAALRTMMKDER